MNLTYSITVRGLHSIDGRRHGMKDAREDGESRGENSVDKTREVRDTRFLGNEKHSGWLQ